MIRSRAAVCYGREVVFKRLLQLGTLLLVLVTVLTPLLECFDRWDKPGLDNDIEFPVFALVLVLCLLLLVMRLVARSALQMDMRLLPGLWRDAAQAITQREPLTAVFVPPPKCTLPYSPLRI